MPAHWLIIVHPERAELAERLRATFAAAFVQTVLDRRVAERRLAGGAAGPDRRRGDRRQPAPTGFRLAHQAQGYVVLESLSRVAITCADCSMLLEFEMPQFREPPARLSTEVRHLERTGALPTRSVYAAPSQTHHMVELVAYTSTGRPLLSCVAQARSPQAFGAPAARSPAQPDITFGLDHDAPWH